MVYLGLLVGVVVWGTSIALLLHGIWTGAWYGYVFSAIFIALGVCLLIVEYRVRRLVQLEKQRIFSEHVEEREQP